MVAESGPLGLWIEGIGWLRLDLLLRLLLAAVLGGMIGLEREISGKPAGFRTNLLICVGAALLTELSIAVSLLAAPSQTNADPARIAAQIVSGIGFLGAGTIIQSRGSVVGLTTAATLWVVAAIGMAVGAQAYVEAVGTAVLVIAALMLLGRVEELMVRRRAERTVQVTLAPEAELIHRITVAFEEAGFHVKLLDVERGAEVLTATYLATGSRKKWRSLLPELVGMPGVRKITQL